MRHVRFAVVIAAVLAAAFPPAVLQGQARKLKVIAADTMPIPYAYVTVEGGIGQITDEKGEVSFGAGKKQTIVVRIQRIGYQPWFGKLDLPDTAVTLVMPLQRIAQSLSAVTVTTTSAIKSLQMTGFYDRWMMRQKGALSAVFIGPEEIESRHPDKITNMLRGLNGVKFIRSCEGEQVAFSSTNQCTMAVLIDGQRQCPSSGCKGGTAGGTFSGAQSSHPNCDSPTGLNATTAVLIDQILSASDVTAIEIYNRGGNVPVSISASDQSCGIIAFWTGSRKP
jgi:hypothetical protein